MVRISHMHTANIQTSDRCVNRRKLIDSGAIHLIGSLPLEATKTNSIDATSRRSAVAYLCNRNYPASVVGRVRNPLVSPIRDWRREHSWPRYHYERDKRSMSSPFSSIYPLPMDELLQFEIGQGGCQLLTVENQCDRIEVSSIRHQIASKLKSIETRSRGNSRPWRHRHLA